MTSVVPRDAVGDGWRIPNGLWEHIEPLLPRKRLHPKGGRPWAPARQCMDGIFYVLRTGCQWKALPRTFGAASTVHLRFQQWRAAGVFGRLWQQGLLEYDARRGLEWKWQAMDGAMTKAPLGGKRNGTESDRPGQKRDQTERVDRGTWYSPWGGCGCGESA